ncbi:MAG: hypothetical protein M1833_005600 [Piccolia ochrophora]|nr:MAG: hypothetical protein M1833_005600 [Piccolia ochrophora]
MKAHTIISFAAALAGCTAASVLRRCEPAGLMAAASDECKGKDCSNEANMIKRQCQDDPSQYHWPKLPGANSDYQDQPLYPYPEGMGPGMGSPTGTGAGTVGIGPTATGGSLGSPVGPSGTGSPSISLSAEPSGSSIIVEDSIGGSLASGLSTGDNMSDGSNPEDFPAGGNPNTSEPGPTSLPNRSVPEANGGCETCPGSEGGLNPPTQPLEQGAGTTPPKGSPCRPYGNPTTAQGPTGTASAYASGGLYPSGGPLPSGGASRSGMAFPTTGSAAPCGDVFSESSSESYSESHSSSGDEDDSSSADFGMMKPKRRRRTFWR